MEVIDEGKKFDSVKMMREIRKRQKLPLIAG